VTLPAYRSPNNQANCGADLLALIAGTHVITKQFRISASVGQRPCHEKAFSQSQEGFAHFGVAAQLHISPDANYIQQLYHTLLNRTGSDAEIAAWQDLKLDVAHLMVGFTESVEYKADTYAYNVVPELPLPAPTIYDEFLVAAGAAHPDQHINVIGVAGSTLGAHLG
jgi:hypothetical protein